MMEFVTEIAHIYIHIPFCHRICPYCSFYKHTPGNTDLHGFVDALLTEITTRSETYTLRPKTIYFGGGTPTLLSRTHLERLFTGMRERIDLSALEEWTMEANPRTFKAQKLQLMADAGVTRVSLGVQSWDPAQLEVLGRDHIPAEAEASFQLLRESEIPTANIDLMFAHPGQSLETWRSDLARTIALQPDHVSTYNLTFEEDTEFFKKFVTGEFEQDPDLDAAYFETMIDTMSAAGFENYEISNHAKPGHQSKHNAAYWAGAEFLGIGPGAVSTIARTRWKNLEDTARYIESMKFRRAAETDIENLTEEQWLIERVTLELRTTSGLPLERLAVLPNATTRIGAIIDAGHATATGNHLTLTRTGKLLADEVAGYLIG